MTDMKKPRVFVDYGGMHMPLVLDEKYQSVTPLKPIADFFGLKWEEQRIKANAPYWKAFFGTCVVTFVMPGDTNARHHTCIEMRRVPAYLMRINPERVRAGGNSSGADFLVAEQAELADAMFDHINGD